MASTGLLMALNGLAPILSTKDSVPELTSVSSSPKTLNADSAYRLKAIGTGVVISETYNNAESAATASYKMSDGEIMDIHTQNGDDRLAFTIAAGSTLQIMEWEV